MGNVTQERLTRRRWAGVLFMALVAAVVVLFCQHWITDWMKPVADRLGSLPWLWRVGIVLAVSTAVWWFPNRRHLSRYTNLERMLRRPPLLVSVFAGTALVLLLRHWWSGFALIPTYPADWADLAHCLEPLFWIFLVPAVWISALAFQDQHRPPRVPLWPAASPQSDAAAQQFISELKTQPLKLIKWFEDDDKLPDPALDVFGHREVAHEIINILNGEDAGTALTADGPAEVRPGAIHLVGPVGSGKSTICKWVEQHFERDDRVRVVRVSLWPYKDAESAVRGVLDQLLDALSNLTDTLSLAGVPEAYTSAVEPELGLAGRLARLAQPASDPEDLLEQLSAVLKCLDMRFVLIVEDYERFLRRDSHTPKGEKAKRRAHELDALFYLLDQCNDLTVIIASVDLKAGFDSQKIARRVFEVPKMAPWDVLDILRNLRDHCLAGNPKAFINPKDDNAFREIDRAAYADDWWGRERTESMEKASVAEAFAQLCSTPRQLKTVLRQTWDIWQAIPGEIEWDSVVLITTIKVCCPDVFVALDDQHVQNCLRTRAKTYRGIPEGRGDLHFALKMLQIKIDENRQAEMVWVLLGYLYPEAEHFSRVGECNHTTHPQAVSATGDVNYFKVMLARRSTSGFPQDQEVLERIQSWRSQPGNQLDELLRHWAARSRLLHFKRIFNNDELVNLLEHSVALKLCKHQPGVVVPPWDRVHTQIWNIMEKRRLPPSQIEKMVLRLIERYCSHNLNDVLDIVEYTAVQQGESRVYLYADGQAAVHRALLAKLSQIASVDAHWKELIASASVFNRSLFQSIHTGIVSRNTKGVDVAEYCDKVGSALLRSLESEPQRAMWLVILLIVRDTREPPTSNIQALALGLPSLFDAAAVLSYFPKAHERLMALIAADSAPQGAGTHERSLRLEASSVAAEWLRSRGSEIN
jgi:hypothetical protein